MKLQDLARRTDTSAASIKYYLRVGLLPAGRKKNATTAVYGEEHVERLELIGALRRILGAPIADIARLTALIDDPEVGILTVMETAQVLASGMAAGPAPGSARSRTAAAEAPTAGSREPGPPASARTDGGAPHAEGSGTGAAPSARVASVIAERCWPDADSAARTALERVLGEMGVLGIVPSDAYLTRASRALDTVSTGDFDFRGTRDRIALTVAVGTHEYSRLVLALLQLSQASRSIAELDPRRQDPLATSDSGAQRDADA